MLKGDKRAIFTAAAKAKAAAEFLIPEMAGQRDGKAEESSEEPILGAA